MEKKDNRLSKILVLAFMGFTLIGMTFSFVFFGFSGPDTKVKYKDFKFKLDQRNNLWLAEIQGRYAAFSFLPEEVSSLNISADLTVLKNKPEIDITYDINDTNIEAIALAQHQMGLVLKEYDVYIRGGLLSENKYALPSINCSSATFSIPVIYLKTGNSSRIIQDGNCIIAEADYEQGFIRLKDRMLYAILGVME